MQPLGTWLAIGRGGCHLIGAVFVLVLGASVSPSQDKAPPPTAKPKTTREEFAAPRFGSEPSEAASDEAEGAEEDHIETDRDSFTPATTTAGAGRLIVESAYSFVDNRDVKETHSFPELLLRYGVNDWLELRLGWNYEVGGDGNDTSGTGFGEGDSAAGELERESRIAYGVKVSLTDQCGWLPRTAVIAQAFTPTSGEENDTQFVGTYVFGWEFSDGWQLDSAARYSNASAEADHYDVWAPSVVLKVPLLDDLNVHAEWFAIFSSSKADDFARHYISPGVHYLVTPDLEIGVRVGWGLSDDSSRFFSNAGVGWRY